MKERRYGLVRRRKGWTKGWGRSKGWRARRTMEERAESDWVKEERMERRMKLEDRADGRMRQREGKEIKMDEARKDKGRDWTKEERTVGYISLKRDWFFSA